MEALAQADTITEEQAEEAKETMANMGLWDARKMLEFIEGRDEEVRRMQKANRFYYALAMAGGASGCFAVGLNLYDVFPDVIFATAGGVAVTGGWFLLIRWATRP